MPRNYHTLAAPKVYLSLLPADRCGEDFEIEGPDHPHFTLDPAPTLATMEAIVAHRLSQGEEPTAVDNVLHSIYLLALVILKQGGDWRLHPAGCLDWPELGQTVEEASVNARVAVLRKLTESDYFALTAAAKKVAALSDDEVKNSNGGSSSRAEESQPPEPQN